MSCICVFRFGTGSCCIAQVGLELVILLVHYLTSNHTCHKLQQLKKHGDKQYIGSPTGEKREPRKDPEVHVPVTLSKGPRNYSGKRMVSSTHAVGKIRHLHAKEWN